MAAAVDVVPGADVVVVPAPGQFPGYPDTGTLYPRDGQKIRGSEVVVVGVAVVVVGVAVVVVAGVQLSVGIFDVPV